MEMNGFMGSFYRISIFISRLAYINFLWILFTLMGVIIFGFMPATVAMFAVTRKWVNGAEDFPIFKTFWQFYKEEFLKANLYGLFFVFTGYIIYINFLLVADQVLWMTIARYILLVISILFIVTVLMFFPVYVHLKLKGSEYLKTALFLGLAYPQYTVIMVFGIVGIQYLMMFLPGLIPFFTASLMAYLLVRIANIIFRVVERKNQAIEEDQMAKEIQVY
ncbi:YesL family protein [Halalkalibacter krulwichiae]|uniref:Membrane protein YesL n=1 Tax=Halalkalibacter krulwichiae TaxID=199441 RepID=A0A1X9M7Z5_9BACI|nr:YesL family protein [Halalkalibacter krulwichiae]ARK29548.1 hypothetical protein BkAM31D_06560 [Halalkalibacter krulwichiae]